VFAGRGIALPGFAVTALVVVGAFGLGLAAGWATGFVPGLVRADPSPSATPSPSPSATSGPQPVLPVMHPITRTLGQADFDAGVTSTEILLKGKGTFKVVPGVGTPAVNGGDVRWVSVAIEDGVASNPAAVRNFVLATLNANQSWGTGGALQFVPTDGVSDYRIVIASPYSAAVLCPDTHVTATLGALTAVAPSPSPSASPSPSPSASESESESAGAADESPWACGDDGVIVISSYDWTAGFSAFGTDYAAAREYLLNHRVGHLLGHADVECTGGRADVMVNQEAALPAGCAANPWPYPDAPASLPESSAEASSAP